MSPQRKTDRGRDKEKQPNYADMADTIAKVGHDLVARADAEGETALALQGHRLLKLAAAIRADLKKPQ